jgi:hypothetical protein
MPLSSGPNTAIDGLILSLDAGDRKNSFLPFSTFLNMTSWSVGSGGASGYNQNGNTNENERVNGTDPWGNSTVVWESRPSGDGNADGGWETSWYDIDRTKLYRFSIWVKRTSSTSGGTSYLGLYGNGGTWGVERLDNGANEGNPYWECNGTGAYTQNVWYLLVGHCYPAGTTGISNNRHPDTGRYTVNGRNGDLNYCNVGGDVRWLSNTTQTLHRTYHFYCGDSTTRLQWFDPRIDLCDGTEPTISDLLKAATNTWRNIVSSDKLSLINGVSYSRNNIGTMVLDGTNDYLNLDTNIQSGFTAASYEFFCRPTSLPGSGNYFQLYIQEASTWIALYNVGFGAFFGIDLNNGSGWFDNNGGSNTGARTNDPLVANTWYHVVFSWESGVVRCYLNGALQSTVSTAQAANGRQNVMSLGGGTTPRNIGSRGGGNYWVGNIAVANSHNRGLTAAEVLNNYTELRKRFDTPIYTYSEGNNASLYVNNWNNSTTYTMADFGGIPNVNAHGFSSGPVTYTLTLNNLPPHTRIRYRVYWHLVDSLDNETNQLFIMNSSGGETEILRFTKQYNLTPNISVSASPGTYTWSGSKSYTYRPWAGGAYGADGYIIVDSGLVDHTSTSFTARHVMGADQAQSDEAEYLSHVLVELY